MPKAREIPVAEVKTKAPETVGKSNEANVGTAEPENITLEQREAAVIEKENALNNYEESLKQREAELQNAQEAFEKQQADFGEATEKFAQEVRDFENKKKSIQIGEKPGETPAKPIVVKKADEGSNMVEIRFIKDHEYNIGTAKYFGKKNDTAKVPFHLATLLASRGIAHRTS